MTGNQTAGEIRRARSARLHPLGVALAVVALLVQSFVIQPHIDGLPNLSANSAGVSAHITNTAPDKAPGACVICQATALAGAITLAASPALLLVERSFFGATPARRQRVVCAAPAHSWQSRAPPHLV